MSSAMIAGFAFSTIHKRDLSDLDMFQVTDDVDEAIEVMVAAQRARTSADPGGGETPGDAEIPD